MSESKKSGNKSIVAAIIIAGGLIAAAVLYIGGAFRPEIIADPEMTEMENAVAADFNDPSSAEFRNVRKSTIGYCGEVNAKNRLGGYVGFKPFTNFKDSKTGGWKTTYDLQLVDAMCK